MHICKVESVTELQQDEGSPASTPTVGLGSGSVGNRNESVLPERPGKFTERPASEMTRKSGTYAKAQVPWLPPQRQTSSGPQVSFADHPHCFEINEALVSPEGACRLVVVEHGAEWPEWLARALSGGVTTYLVAEAIGDGLGGLVNRVERRAQSCETPVSQLIWLSAQPKRWVPLRWVKRLTARINPYETLVVVPRAMPVQSVRYGLRRQTRPTTWPRAVVA